MVPLEPGKVLRIGDHPVLDRLGHPGGKLRRRQRGQRLQVHKHEARLMKRAQQVLAARDVHAGLATDGGIDHRQQRRRHLHITDAPEVGRRHKPRYVAGHAAAQRDHDAVATEARFQQAVRQRRPGLSRLVPLARWERVEICAVTRLPQRGNERIAVARCHVRVADHRVRRGRAGPREQCRKLRQQAPADQDVVGCVALRPAP